MCYFYCCVAFIISVSNQETESNASGISMYIALIPLPSQTWIHLPSRSKANHCREGKCRCQERTPGQLVLKRPELLAWDKRCNFLHHSPGVSTWALLPEGKWTPV
ncbi:unnamed protein product [Rangifer tarandus platyrhynchus]|uniref:Uncharacterized protein n=1 Tax=Rangifer tarandus platyrhynchus TaxID=3082113 RepID=A0ACB1MLC0_RANTA